MRIFEEKRKDTTKLGTTVTFIIIGDTKSNTFNAPTWRKSFYISDLELATAIEDNTFTLLRKKYAMDVFEKFYEDIILQTNSS